ncbi:MAG TPA: sigma factor-like helix-turn-helix DNA-binding protein [Candidatus Nanoarchaeia archaeon]|nr:sigma factor-like helix-turn-helix DNA-binding protein [Candidatus Nanoarchaeia archaeon]
MKLKTEVQCPNCKAEFVIEYEVDSIAGRKVYSDFSDDYVHRLASSYAPLGCFLLLCQVANLKATADRAFRWLREYRVEFDDQIRRVLSSLTPREEKVLIFRYGLAWSETKTLQEIGIQKDFRLSRQRVHHIEQSAIKRLRHPTRRRILKDLIERIKK